MTLLSLNKGEWLSSTVIAGSLNVNPALVRKELIVLKEAGLIESKEGKNGGIRILKDPGEIRLSEIFSIVKGSGHVLSSPKNAPNPKCRVGRQINVNLDIVLGTIDEAIVGVLTKQTLAEFSKAF